MSLDLHHAHLFASNIDATVNWWCQHMGAKVFFDKELSGSRNVFLAVGTGRLHVYDQAPRDQGRGAIHHLGIKVSTSATFGSACKPKESLPLTGCGNMTVGGTL
jgi:catechol 2,3-dioxygenase-like lactoylglutathione lyase family enzyme